MVSVVFADLVGFTSFSEASDPEQVKALVDECFEALCADVEAYGGQVDKIVGDALLHVDAVRGGTRLAAVAQLQRHERV